MKKSHVSMDLISRYFCSEVMGALEFVMKREIIIHRTQCSAVQSSSAAKKEMGSGTVWMSWQRFLLRAWRLCTVVLLVHICLWFLSAELFCICGTKLAPLSRGDKWESPQSFWELDAGLEKKLQRGAPLLEGLPAGLRELSSILQGVLQLEIGKEDRGTVGLS